MAFSMRNTATILLQKKPLN
jgi:hypothetical protein